MPIYEYRCAACRRALNFLVRSIAGDNGRPRLYSQGDLERLRVRRDARAGHGAVAAGALRFGEPVLESAITAITTRGPAYRGQLATDLATSGIAFENVAEFLWSGYLPTTTITWPRATLPKASLAKLLPEGSTPLDAMSLLLPLAALADPRRADARPDAIIACGRQLIPLLATTFASNAASMQRALSAPSVAAIIARALGLGEASVPLINLALVLLADHELNASSFTARIAASTHADPYACVIAALATLSGPRHGSASEEVARFADEVGSPQNARAAVRALRKRGENPPGFGLPIYPGGDPRAQPLLDAVRNSRNRCAQTLLALVDETKDSAPTVDVGLAALVASLGAAPPVASGIFAVARSAGWIAHVLEQRAANYILRPRARYSGVAVAP